MTKKERLAAFNKGNIISAAQALFAERGVAQTTVDDIAKAADCSKSTLYVYFSSKEEIYDHIVLISMNALKELIKEAIAKGGEARASYEAICRALVAFHDAYPLYFDSVISKISVGQHELETQPVRRDIYYAGEEINAELVRLIESAQKQGVLRTDVRPIVMVFVLWADIYGLLCMSDHKANYFQRIWSLSREDYLHMGFEMLWRSISQEATI